MMKIYIISTVAVSILASVILLLTPDGKNGGLSKHVKLLTSLCILAAISDPLISFSKEVISGSFENVTSSLTEGVVNPDSELIFSETVSGFSASQLESEISELICSEFGINSSDVDVSASYTASDSSVIFNAVSVRLSGIAIFKDPRSVESYVTALTGLDCKCGIK